MCNDISFAEKLTLQRSFINSGGWFRNLVSFSNCNLRGRVFSGLNLSEANFRGADLEGAIFDGAILKQNDLTYANVNGASFRNCRLANVSFIRASVKNCIFTGSVITNSSFAYADLTGTNLSMENVEMRYCTMENAIIDNTPQTPVPVLDSIRGRNLINVYVDDSNVFNRIREAITPDPYRVIGMINPLYESTIMGIMERRSSEAIQQEYDRQMFRDYENSVMGEWLPESDNYFSDVLGDRHLMVRMPNRRR